MTVSTTDSRISYSGNDSTTDFSFPYKFLANGDLTVTSVVNATGAETTEVLDTDYTVSGAGDASGGTVAMTTAPATGVTLVISRQMDITQETDYISGESFPAETHEAALDRLTLIAQQLDDAYGRALRLTEGTTGVSTELPDAVAGYLLAFDDSAASIAAVAPGSSVIYVGTSAPDESVFPLWYDSTNTVLKFHDGSSWVTAASVDVTGKADRDTDAVTGNVAEFDANGHPVDSGVAASDVVVDADLASYAPLASPTFTGTPSLPTGTTGVTQSAGDDSTKLATTAYVDAAGVFSESFTSSDQTITSGGVLTLAHGLSTAPKLFTFEIVCQTGEFSYLAGDVAFAHLNSTSSSTTRINGVYFDATNIYFRFTSHTHCFTVNDKATGSQSEITNANWKLRVRAWA